MRPRKISRLFACVMVATALVSPAAMADIGEFTSFTTTMTPSTGAFVFDISLETTGADTPSSSEVLFVDLYFVNVDAGTWGWDETWLHRPDTGNVFSGSYTFTGVPNHQYKWELSTDFWTGWVATTTFDAFQSMIWDPWSSQYVDPFFSSLISGASTVANMGGLTANAGIRFAANLVSGVASVSQPRLIEVPTLGQWGLLALGGALLGTGAVALRRSGR